MHNRLALFPLLALIACAAACGAEPSPADEDVAVAKGAITNTAETYGYPFAVQIKDGCTAVVLSRHYLLTAGHCVDRQTVTNLCIRHTDIGGSHTLYNGDADVAHPPGYIRYVDANDLAIIHLRDNGLTQTSSIPIYLGPDAPWKEAGGTVSVAGFGYGSLPGEAQSCNTGGLVFGVKRVANLRFCGTGATEPWPSSTWLSAAAQSSTRALCPGDSGGPWFINPNGWNYLVAVSSLSYLEPNQPAFGALVAPHVPWIVETSQEFTPHLACPEVTDHRNGTVVRSAQCTEPNWEPGPPRPPVPCDPPDDPTHL
jgi:hypothetical protein